MSGSITTTIYIVVEEVYKRVGYQNIHKNLLHHDIDLDLSTRDFMTLVDPEGKVRVVYRGAKDDYDWELVKATIMGNNKDHPELKKVDEHIQKVFEKYGRDNKESSANKTMGH